MRVPEAAVHWPGSSTAPAGTRIREGVVHLPGVLPQPDKTVLDFSYAQARHRLTPEQQAITTPSAAVALMEEYSSVIRRPIVENEAGEILVGFDPTLFDSFVR